MVIKPRKVKWKERREWRKNDKSYKKIMLSGKMERKKQRKRKNKKQKEHNNKKKNLEKQEKWRKMNNKAENGTRKN